MISESLPSFRFDTAAVAAADRFDAWQAVLGGVCSLRAAEGLEPAACSSKAEAWHLGAMVAVDLQTNSQSHARTSRHIRSDQLDHYRLALKLEGCQTCDIGDHMRQMAPGTLLVVDQAQPECSHFHGDEGRTLVFYMPREMLDELLPNPVDLHGLALHGPMAGLLTDHLTSLVRHLPNMRAVDANAVTAATLQLFAAAIDGSAATRERAQPVIESSQLRQACRHIESHLADPALSAESIASFFRMSRATLYRLFEPLGGVAAYIKERRLLRIHAALATSGSTSRVQHLAEAHGFKSTTHMSREFRRLFGYTPTQAHGQGAVPITTLAPSGHRTVQFHDWVRAMRH
ncbi:MAG: helix-turn-helix domain-containing protein [Burkholderiales bacterium]